MQQLVALKPEAVAINLLFSFLAPTYEQRIEAAIERALPDVLVSRSSRVLPEYKEYERGVATWLNASHLQSCRQYSLKLVLARRAIHHL